MNRLQRLEILAQRLIEGTFNRLFAAPPLQSTAVSREPQTETKENLAVVTDQAARWWSLQHGKRRLRLGEPVVSIGRALDNDVILSDPTVSRYHAQLRWRQGRYHLCPPAPKNGATGRQVDNTKHTNHLIPRTTINRQPAIQQPLDPGDVISLGDTILVVVVERIKA